MPFSGATIYIRCGACGTDFAVDAPGTEPEYFQTTGSAQARVPYECPNCGKSGDITVFVSTPSGN
jgi:hypothetical protein